MQISRVDQLPAFRAKVNPASRFVEWTSSGQVATSAVDFHQLVTTLTQALEKHIQKGKFVVILHDRTRVRSLAAEFATMSLGGVVCPLTWAPPYERPISAISNLGNPLILYPADLDDQQHLPTEYDLAPIPDLSDNVEGVALNLDTPEAMVVTTSGTSGAPKGVVLSHDAVASTLISALAVSPIEKGHTVLSFLPVSHILERMMFYVALASGADIHLATSPQHAFWIVKKVRPHFLATVPKSLERVIGAFNTAVERSGFFRRTIFQWSITQAGSGGMLTKWIASRIVLRHLKRVFGCRIRGIFVGGAGIATSILEQLQAAGLQVRAGYGLTEACGLVSVNRFKPGGNVIGSVGLPLPGVQVRIERVDSDRGEICVKSAGLFDGYIVAGKLTSSPLKDGWLHTGDSGFLDKDGFLFVVGRLRNTFKNSYAQYVAPEPIERSIRALPGVDHCMVVGNNRPHNAALILPDFDWLQNWCRENNVHWTSAEYMLFNPDVRGVFEKRLDEINQGLSRHEHIGGFALVHEPWNQESGLTTATLKIRREQLESFYAKVIDEIYKS